ncbi:MAG TPA: hypothetical protein VL219_01270 [Steroidobacteraceae bacterium]|nr:hypothetical protein [Steroidobacteraceae bacterium]
MDALYLSEKCLGTLTADASRQTPLPVITHAERAFWRRAVEAERSRQRRGRPAPFPFQPA